MVRTASHRTADTLGATGRAAHRGGRPEDGRVRTRRRRVQTSAIRAIITECHRLGITCSICGQAPSVPPEYAHLLVGMRIDSISVNPDAIDATRRNVEAAEQRVLLRAARRADERVRLAMHTPTHARQQCPTEIRLGLLRDESRRNADEIPQLHRQSAL